MTKYFMKDDLEMGLQMFVRLICIILSLSCTLTPLSAQKKEIPAGVQAKTNTATNTAIDEAQDAMARCFILVRAGRIGAALAEADIAIAASPNSPEPYAAAAAVNMIAADPKAALPFFEKGHSLASGALKEKLARAIEECKEDILASEKKNAADSLVDKGEYAAAAKAYSNLFIEFPVREDCGLAAADAFVLAGEHQKAAGIYESLLKSQNPSIASKSAKSLRKLKSVIPSMSGGTAADASEKPENLLGGTEYVDGLALMQSKLYADAELELSKAIAKIAPAKGHAKFYLARGEARIKMGYPASAIADLTQALLIDPELGDAYRLRAECSFALKDYQRAVEDYGRALEFIADPGIKKQVQRKKEEASAKAEAMLFR